jgi:ABC-type transport system involved in Fe-S cluster assembly fused permease/ATPase subunit
LLFLVVLFVAVIVFLAFYLNTLLDRRAEKRLREEAERRKNSV